MMPPRVQTHTLSGAMICNYERNIAHPLNLQNEARPCLVRCISERTRFYHIKALTESPREPHVRPVAGLASPRDHPSPESALGSALWTTSDRLVSITCIAQCTLTQRGSLLELQYTLTGSLLEELAGLQTRLREFARPTLSSNIDIGLRGCFFIRGLKIMTIYVTIYLINCLIFETIRGECNYSEKYQTWWGKDVPGSDIPATDQPMTSGPIRHKQPDRSVKHQVVIPRWRHMK